MMDRYKKVMKNILKFRNDRDWKQFHTMRNLAGSISIEANELLEKFQWEIEPRSLSDLSEEEKVEIQTEEGKKAAEILLKLAPEDFGKYKI